jgi:hypothetical protein
MRERALARHVVDRLAEHPDKRFSDHKAWTAHLDVLGITALKVNPDPVMITTESALWGSIKAHGLLPNTVIVSDDAGTHPRPRPSALIDHRCHSYDRRCGQGTPRVLPLLPHFLLSC